MHVVMVGWEYPPHHSGGLGVHCYEISRELVGLGYRVTFLLPRPDEYVPVAGVTLRWPEAVTDPRSPRADRPWRPAYDWGSVGRPGETGANGNLIDYNEWVAGLDFPEPVDIVHVHDWFGTEGAFALSCRLKVPLVMTIHSTEYDRSLGFANEEIVRRERFGLVHADLVIAVSRHLREQVIRRYGVAPSRVRVVYNAVRPPEDAPRRPAPGRLVVYIGRLAAMKGVDTFLRAAARVVPGFPDATFVIAGEGPERNQLLRLSGWLGIGDRVWFLGRVDERERQELLSAASVFVLPSVVEPFGIAALEAMAAGVPTIVSKTSGVAEITGSVFRVDFWDVEEFASRIAELLSYPTLQSALGEQGRRDALREGWRDRAIQTARLYEEVRRERNSR